MWYVNHPHFFEKKYFLNELFSLIGLFVFLSHPVIYKRKDYIYNSVMMILFIFSVYAAGSLMVFQDLYGYLRNTVIVYSIFSFFLGMKLYQMLQHVSSRDLLFLSALLPSGSFYRVSYAASLPIYLSRYIRSFNGHSLLMVLGIIVGVKLYYGGMTSIAVVLLLIVLRLLTRRTVIFFYITLILTIAGLLLFLRPYLEFLLREEFRIDDILPLHPLLTIDRKASTRFFLWAYAFYEVFLNNLLGIGLGTTLMPSEFLWEDMRMLFRDPHVEYTLGVHNSFLTILARFGIIGLLPFITLNFKLINDFIRDKEKKSESRTLFFYYSFFIITGCAQFNVVLESPMHASVYWGTLGILYQAKQSLTNT